LVEKNKRNEEFIFLKCIYGENNLDILILRLSHIRRAALASKSLDYCLDKYLDFDTFGFFICLSVKSMYQMAAKEKLVENSTLN